MFIGIGGLLAAQALGIVGLRHRGYELLTVIGMALLLIVGLVALGKALGL